MRRRWYIWLSIWLSCAFVALSCGAKNVESTKLVTAEQVTPHAHSTSREQLLRAVAVQSYLKAASDRSNFFRAAADRSKRQRAQTAEKKIVRTVTVTASTYKGNPTGTVNGYPCGGDLPPCWVLTVESHGNPRAINHTGCHGRGCYGLWQFDPLTWGGFGGFSRADLAPPGVQNEKARQTWAGGRGCSNWGAC